MNRIITYLPRPRDFKSNLESWKEGARFQKAWDADKLAAADKLEALEREWCKDVKDAYDAGVEDCQTIVQQSFKLGVAIGAVYAIFVGTVLGGFVWSVWR